MFKGRHFDRSVILLCVRWYLAYGWATPVFNADQVDGWVDPEPVGSAPAKPVELIALRTLKRRLASFADTPHLQSTR